jgi:hypothetical protein
MTLSNRLDGSVSILSLRYSMSFSNEKIPEHLSLRLAILDYEYV